MVITIILVSILAAIGLWTVISFGYYLYRYQGDNREPLKWARFRIEWHSNCFTYREMPYRKERDLDMLMALLSGVGMREEVSFGQKSLIEDKVKSVTIVHTNWPAPKEKKK